MKILLDFDNTCVFSTEEEFCTEDTGAEQVLKKLIAKGHDLILWTCRNHSKNNPNNYLPSGKYREEDSLDEALRWFKEKDIKLCAVNHVPGSKEIVGDSRKPLADIVIDDLNLGTPLIVKSVECINYETREKTMRDVYCVNWVEIEKLLKQRGAL